MDWIDYDHLSSFGFLLVCSLVGIGFFGMIPLLLSTRVPKFFLSYHHLGNYSMRSTTWTPWSLAKNLDQRRRHFDKLPRQQLNVSGYLGCLRMVSRGLPSRLPSLYT